VSKYKNISVKEETYWTIISLKSKLKVHTFDELLKKLLEAYEEKAS